MFHWIKAHALIILIVASLIRMLVNFTWLNLTALFLLILILYFRNEAVYKKRKELIAKAKQLGDLAYMRGEDEIDRFLVRFNVLPSYHRMINEFWTPLSQYEISED